MADSLLKFMLGDGNVRGVAVRLRESWQEMLRRRRHEAGVQELLGEMSAASVLLAGSLKFDGTLVLQIQGDGPLRLAVAECQPDFGLRATATARVDDDAEVPSQPADFAQLTNSRGAGRCVITLDPRQPGQQPYQGIVALNDAHGQALPTLSAVLEQYLAQSEQIESMLLLASDARSVGGLLLQRMPGVLAGRDSPEEDFSRARHLASTLTDAELLGLAPEEVLRRLFWEEDVRIFAPHTPRFHCTCSRERVAGMLRMLGREEVDSILREQGEVDVRCEFCGQGYAFDAVDAAQVFLLPIVQPPVSPGSH